MSPPHTDALLGRKNDVFEDLTSGKLGFSSLSFKFTVAVLKILLTY